MSIDFEQVSSLSAGDVIRLTGPGDVTVQGRLVEAPEGSRGLSLGPGLQVRRSFDGYPAQHWIDGRFNLTVVEKAKPPLYVNHPRTEPVAGDVVAHVCEEDGLAISGEMPHSMKLLVDGETGQVVK